LLSSPWRQEPLHVLLALPPLAWLVSTSVDVAEALPAPVNIVQQAPTARLQATTLSSSSYLCYHVSSYPLTMDIKSFSSPWQEPLRALLALPPLAFLASTCIDAAECPPASVHIVQQERTVQLQAIATPSHPCSHVSFVSCIQVVCNYPSVIIRILLYNLDSFEDGEWPMAGSLRGVGGNCLVCPWIRLSESSL
jgi:hypothetical protein